MAVYDRLTNKDNYTGMYGARFEGVNPDEFKYKKPVASMNDTEKFEAVFAYYCHFGRTGVQTTLDSFTFQRLCRECKVVDTKCTKTDLDLIFTKSKQKNLNKINFREYEVAMVEIAKKKGFSDLAGLVGACPLLITPPDPQKMPSDSTEPDLGQPLKSTPKAVEKKPTTVAVNKTTTNLPTKTVAAKKTDAGGGVYDRLADQSTYTGMYAKRFEGKDFSKQERDFSSMTEDQKLKAVFEYYCEFGKTGATTVLDSFTFQRLSRECGLIDAKCTKTDIDLIFTKNKTKTARNVTYDQYLACLHEIAAKKFPGKGAGAYEYMLANCPGLSSPH